MYLIITWVLYQYAEFIRIFYLSVCSVPIIEQLFTFHLHTAIILLTTYWYFFSRNCPLFFYFHSICWSFILLRLFYSLTIILIFHRYHKFSKMFDFLLSCGEVFDFYFYFYTFIRKIEEYHFTELPYYLLFFSFFSFPLLSV